VFISEFCPKFIQLTQLASRRGKRDRDVRKHIRDQRKRGSNAGGDEDVAD
jgi:hypothetical protein